MAGRHARDEPSTRRRRPEGAHRRSTTGYLVTERYGRAEGRVVGTCQCGGPIATLRHETGDGRMTDWYPPVCSTPHCMIRKLSREADYLRDPWPWGGGATIDAVYPGLQTQMLGRCACGDAILRLRHLRDPDRRPGAFTPWFPPFCSTVECMIRALCDEAGHLARTAQWIDPGDPGRAAQSVGGVH